MKTSPIWLNLLEWAVIGSAIGLLSITETFQWYVIIGIALLGIAIGLRSLRTKQWIVKTGLELPISLFMFSAGIATWIAVDRLTALLQLARMLGAIVLFYAVILSDSRLRPWLVGGFLVAEMSLAIYWPMQHNFSAVTAKFSWIANLGAWVNQILPSIPGPSIHPNVAAGSLAPAIPFAIAMLCYAGWRKLWLVGLAVLSGILVLSSVILSSSRGAWLGILAAALLVGLVVVQRKWFIKSYQSYAFWIVILAIGVVGLIGLSTSGGLERLMGQMPDPTGTLQSRVSLWRQGVLLIGDYPLTGSGLMGFRMVYAIYGILIHVPHHDHLHNTYLEIWLEQGIFGLLALIWGLAVITQRAWKAFAQGWGTWWGIAGIASLCILAVHGIFDVVFYVERTLPLIGFFTGMAWLIYEPQLPGITVAGKRKIEKWVAIGVAVGFTIGIAIFSGRLMSIIYSNLGAVLQTRLELNTYDASHFDDPTLDQVRLGLVLEEPVTLFQHALVLNPNNRTARQRLAEIYLSTMQYQPALDLMQGAWDAGLHDEITQLLFGDALVAAGMPQAAAEIVKGLPWAPMRLDGEAWYRYYRLEDYPRARSAWEAVLLINPADTGALNGLTLIKDR